MKDFKIVRYFEFLKWDTPYSFISWLPDIVHKGFCTPDGAMDPPSSMFIAGEIKELPCVKVFFETPCNWEGVYHVT